MSDDHQEAMDPPQGEGGTPPKKRTWAKPVVRPLYQIETVSNHPTFDPNKVGEFGTAYRGTS